MEFFFKADGCSTCFRWYAHGHVSWQSAVKGLLESKTLNCGNLFYYDNNLVIRMDPTTSGKMFCFKGSEMCLLFFFSFWNCLVGSVFWILFLYCFQFLCLSPSYVLRAVYTNTSVFAFKSTIFCFLFCIFFFKCFSVVLHNFHYIFFCRWKGEMKSSRQTKVTVKNSAGRLTDHSVGTGKILIVPLILNLL